MPPRRRAPVGTAVLAAALLTGTALLTRAARGVPAAMGAPAPAMLAAAARSPHAAGGRFRNTQPGVIIAPRTGALARDVLTRGRAGRPPGPVPLVTLLTPAVAGSLAVTWLGHSTALVEVEGRRVLTDPVWSQRVSPSRLLGPRRLHPPPFPLHLLPPVDAVLISHDHYDHLDLATVRALQRLGSAPFVVPVGVGAHLRRWGVPVDRVVELDWNESVTVGDLTLTCTEARHFSGRGLVRNTTQWASWAIAGPVHRIFFGGDTGLHDALSAIGAELGPFDITLLPVGAYSDHWPDVHMTPEQAVEAHGALGGGLLVPVHWATFDLGFHRWAEPVERLRVAAAGSGVPMAVPRPGGRVDAAAPPPVRDWWSAP